jgi:transmembrane sensor
MVRSRAEYLINKLISNTLTGKELDELLEGLGKDEILQEYSPILENYFNELVEEERSPSSSEQTIKPDDEVAFSRPKTTHLPVQTLYTDYGGIAAFITLLFSLGTLYYFFTTSDSPLSTALNQPKHGTFAPNIPTKEETVPRGKRKSLRLSDGSMVKLNSDTKIRFPNAFGQAVRTVSLHGEAFFDVERDESKPFVISVGDLQIKVLGTSFNVKNYDDENEMEITVRSGRVSVNLNAGSSTPIILIKDQKLIYSKSTESFRITDVNAIQESSWVNGSLQFNNTPLIAVERTLEKWYDVDIIIENKLLYQTSFTGVHLNESLDSMLESITYAIDAQYEINGKTVIIRN